ncbi:hypothetical protein LPB137_03085 [Poseidonibacter parvus]|uniref:BLUF domain-containing protein n=1 Tax=Poseidonibacter parvus TaxID=1850254 RepID=A0A1P8KK15_9BACT|nr:BLUF domain-containing protein [Poseidonibacter parvus]APW64898.1 hypothetical protein LPB137_03085 [Poseidonibacter parvus]
MYRIMYMSTATRNILDDELEEILEKARINNHEKELTGLLIVKGRTFLQCLEGEKHNVLEVYNKILKDDRHENIIDLVDENDATRLFPNWDMGYKNLKSLNDIKSEKIREILSVDQLDIKKDEIAEIIEDFVSFN